ncbi:MAG: hypothetical protein OIF57_13960 [Marinobacterium sp.]|nr:hypothetical protein [Marinobacterium sp.]
MSLYGAGAIEVTTGLVYEQMVQGFNTRGIVQAMYQLRGTEEDAALLLESCSPEEADQILNPGTGLITEAVVATYNRLANKMAALLRVFGRYLPDHIKTESKPSIGPDRKNGLFAYKTVTFTFDDGQTASILFHSPDNDPRKLGSDEKLIAYRWMMNKRDITAVVSPENGADIDLDTMAKRIAQLVAANHDKFVAAQAKRDSEVAALQALRDKETELTAQVESSTHTNAGLAEDIETMESKVAALKEQLAAAQKAAAEAQPEPEPEAEPEPENTPEPEPEPETENSAGDLEELNPTLYRDIVGSMDTIEEIDAGKQPGMNRSLFVQSIANKLRTQLKNGNVEVVEAALLLIAQRNTQATKPIITGRNSVWKLTGNNMAHYQDLADDNALPADTPAQEPVAEPEPESDPAAAPENDPELEPDEAGDQPGDEPDVEPGGDSDEDQIRVKLAELMEETDIDLFGLTLDALAEEAEEAELMDELEPLFDQAADKLTELMDQAGAA